MYLNMNENVHNNWGEPERAPHKRYSNACNIWYMYICMVHLSSVRHCIDSVQGCMQSFVLKSLRSETTATACSNLAHLCNNFFPCGVMFKRGYARHQGNQASRCNRISDSTEDRRLVEKLVSDSTQYQRLAHRENRIARKTRTTLRTYRASGDLR